MDSQEKIQLFSDIAVIKEKLINIDSKILTVDGHYDKMLNELKPAVKTNTRFRLMITGFICISVPTVTFVMRYVI